MKKNYVIIIFLGAILGIFLLQAIFIDGLPAIQLGRFNIYILDIVSVLLLAIIPVKLIQSRFRIKKMMILPMIIGGLLVLSYLRGLFLFGIEGATNAIRAYLYFYATLMATLILFDEESLHTPIKSGWMIAAWVLIGLVVIRWVMVAFGWVSVTSWETTSDGLMMRVINAAQTFVLLQALIFSFNIKTTSKLFSFQNLLWFVGIPIIILLQHRTIWIIFTVLIFIYILQYRKMRPYLLFASILFIFIIAIALIFFGNHPVMISLLESASNLGTFSWRIEGWGQLLQPERFQNKIDYVIGQPLGTGYDRYVTDRAGNLYLVTVSPHNFYLQTFLNIGIIGLLALVMTYFIPLIALLKSNRNALAFSFSIIIISHLLYFITYAPSYEQGILLGAAILLSQE